MQLLAAAFDEIVRFYTITLIALGIAAIFAVRARRQHRIAPETTGARLRWYWPVFIAGFQCIGGLQMALRCDGIGASIPGTISGVRASLVAAALVMVLGTLASMAIERIAWPLRKQTFVPMPVFAAMIAVVLNTGLVAQVYGDLLWS